MVHIFKSGNVSYTQLIVSRLRYLLALIHSNLPREIDESFRAICNYQGVGMNIQGFGCSGINALYN